MVISNTFEASLAGKQVDIELIRVLTIPPFYLRPQDCSVDPKLRRACRVLPPGSFPLFPLFPLFPILNLSAVNLRPCMTSSFLKEAVKQAAHPPVVNFGLSY